MGTIAKNVEAEVRGEQDISAVLDLFRLNYERLTQPRRGEASAEEATKSSGVAVTGTG